MELLVFNLNDEADVGVAGLKLLAEVVGCLHGASSCKQIVVEQHHVVAVDGIFMDF